MPFSLKLTWKLNKKNNREKEPEGDKIILLRTKKFKGSTEMLSKYNER